MKMRDLQIFAVKILRIYEEFSKFYEEFRAPNHLVNSQQNI